MNKKIDRHYQESRNMLIPLAESFANDKCGTSQGPGEDRADWAARWSTAFLDRMDELAREQGIIK